MSDEQDPLPFLADQIGLSPFTLSTPNYQAEVSPISIAREGVSNHWTGPLEWTTGLDYWTT